MLLGAIDAHLIVLLQGWYDYTKLSIITIITKKVCQKSIISIIRSINTSLGATTERTHTESS